MDYSIYLKTVQQELSKLLSERRAAGSYHEKEVQSFFEEYPCALLGALTGIPMKDNIFNNVIISQPRMKSEDGDRQPDFLVVTYNSLQMFFNFIELEDPSKKIFLTSVSEMPSSEFHRAFTQLRQWASFTQNEVKNYCETIVKTLFKDSYDNSEEKVWHYNYLLIYGFSDEVLDFSKKYNSILQDSFNDKRYYHSTYSRLLDSLRLNKAPLFTVKKTSKEGQFKAIGLTPFENYTKFLWYDFHNIHNKQEIVTKSSWLTNEQKDKLNYQMTEMDKKAYDDFRTTHFEIKDFGDLELP